MTFKELEVKITARIAVCEMPSKKGNGKPRKLSPTYLKPIISTARKTITFQIARRNGVSWSDAEELLRNGEDVAPYLMAMPQAAFDRARVGRSENGSAGAHRRPGNARYLARLAFRLGCESGAHQVWSKGGEHLVPDGWKQVIDDVIEAYAPTAKGHAVPRAPSYALLLARRGKQAM